MSTRPNRFRIRHLLCFLTLCLVASTGVAAAQSDEVVARIGDQPITLGELEKAVETQLRQLEQQRHMLLEGALDGLIDQKLLEREAAKQGVDAAALLAKEVTAKVPEISSAEVDAWYLANRQRVGDRSKEELAPQIQQYLAQQEAAALRTSYLEGLRAEYGVERMFEPLRTEFDLSNATWKGPEDAPVTLVEFSDFQCPACRGFNPIIDQLLGKYPEQVRVAFLQFPLRQIHPQAQDAAEAALCARDQDQFWAYHDALFADQSKLQPADLKATARELGLDGETFDQCLESDKYASTVQEDLDQGAAIGASGTPAVFVNGRAVSPGRVPSLEMLAELVEDELARQSD